MNSWLPSGALRLSGGGSAGLRNSWSSSCLRLVCPKMGDQTLQLREREARWTLGTARALIAVTIRAAHAFRPAPMKLGFGDDAAHSMTSWARSRIAGGIVRPSAAAVFRLITSSYLDACSTGRSAGFAPLRILST